MENIENVENIHFNVSLLRDKDNSLSNLSEMKKHFSVADVEMLQENEIQN